MPGAADPGQSRRLTWDPGAYLDSLQPFGWRLGLERMRKLTTALGLPQHRFASIHVVGTNGKSSVARMTAALLEAHGVAAGACVSPHLSRWSERTLFHGEEIEASAWAAAVEQVSCAAEGVDRTLEEGDAVTQFEAATAASFLALATAGVEAAAIEAGLGGRLDATNTIPSRVTVLTSIGLDHTEWLGGTEAEIAAEKLAVLRDQTALVLGQVSPPVQALAEATATERGARLIRAPAEPGTGLRLRAAGAFQRRNFALATSAAEAFLGELDPERVAAVGATLAVPGRLERVAERPPTFLDAAHNPDATAALAESLPAIAAGGPVVACLAILGGKDAEAMIEALTPALRHAVCTEIPAAALAGHGRPGASSWPAAQLVAACERAGLPAEAEPDLGTALARARALGLGGSPFARIAGKRTTAHNEEEGTLIVTGSHYLLAPARALLAAGGDATRPG